jgi:hypothetical protein
MPQDLKYIVKQVTKRYGGWPETATHIRLDYDGEICFYTISQRCELDFYPKNVEKAKGKHLRSTRYTKEQFEKGTK